MVSIERAGLQDIELAHKGGQIGLEGLDHEMEMGGHQDIAIEPDLVGLNLEPKAVDKHLAVRGIIPDGLARTPATRRVVEGTRIGQA